MRILICGDLHLHDTYLERSEKVLNWILEKVFLLKPDLFVFLGDLFEIKDRIPNVLLELVDDFVYRIKCDKVFIVGNHDIAHDTITAPFINRLVSRVEDCFRIDNLLFVGYKRNYKDFISVLEAELKPNDILFCHNEIIPITTAYYKTGNNVVSLLKEKKVRYAFAGHIHSFDSYENKYFHVGSVFQRDFRDAFINGNVNFHGLVLLDSSVEFIPLYEDLTDLPIYVVLDKKVTSTEQKIKEILKKLSNNLKVNNNINLLIHTALKQDISEIVYSILGDRVGKLLIDEIIEDKDAQTVLEATSILNVEDMMKELVSGLISDTELQKEYLSCGLEIYNSVHTSK